jgi:glycosyltransferase involved in cell wall biosynthesis
MTGQPLVSVIVPAYNVGGYVTKCLESIRAQTFDNIEIICVYQPSRDDTWVRLDKFRNHDHRLIILEREICDLGGARNRGLDCARGEYVAFIDSDDWVESDMLEALYSRAVKLAADMVICAINTYDDRLGRHLPWQWGYSLDFPKNLNDKAFGYRELPPETLISARAPVTAWNKLYRHEFLKQHELRFPENLRYEDNPFYYEAMIKAEKVAFTRNRYYNYRVNRKGSIQSSSGADSKILDIIPILKLIHETLVKNGVEEKYLSALAGYAVDELVWRYKAISGFKRLLLREAANVLPAAWNDELRRELDYENSMFYGEKTERLVKVTIIIPVYNAEKYIEACLDSVLTQSMQDIEVICVDDASTDSSLDIIQRRQVTDSRVKLLRSSENKGPGVCRNQGLSIAAGEFVAFVDADDLYPDPDTLAALYEAAITSKAAVCGGNIECFLDDGTTIGLSGCIFLQCAEMSYQDYAPKPTWGFQRFIYNLEIILENDIRFPEISFYEDPLFLVRFMRQAGRFMALNRLVYRYRKFIPPRHVPAAEHPVKLMEACRSFAEILPMLMGMSPKLHAQEYKVFIDILFMFEEQSPDAEATKKIITQYAKPILDENWNFSFKMHETYLRLKRAVFDKRSETIKRPLRRIKRLFHRTRLILSIILCDRNFAK